MGERAGRVTPPQAGLSEEALNPLQDSARERLALALSAHGLSLGQARRRSGELRLELLHAERGGVWAVVLPRRAGDEAFVRTRRFSLGYLSEPGEGADVQAFALLRALGRALEQRELAALLANELVDASGRPVGTGMRALREIAPGRGDLYATLEGALVDFDVARCSRAASVPPRRLGPSALVLLGPSGMSIHRATAEIVPGDALHYRKNIVGRARWFDGEGWRRLRLHERCRDCPARHACAGCFEAELVSDVGASSSSSSSSSSANSAPTDEVVKQLQAFVGEGRGVEILGGAGFRRWVQAQISSPKISGQASGLVIEGEQLTERRGRARLGKALGALGPETPLLILGRSPELIVGEVAGTSCPVDDPLHIAPAEAARVARSLRGTVLSLADYRLPGRHDADPWWLRCKLRPPSESPALPIDLLLVANRKCVTVCRYCNLPLRLRASTSLRDAWANIEEAAVLGAREMQFFGGEVTLRPELYPLVAYANRLGLPCDLATTAVGLGEAGLERLATCGVRDLSVSIDSPDPAVHDDLKNREGMFDVAVAASQRLKKLGARWVGLNTVVTPMNYLTLAEVVELAHELGLDNVTFFFCQPIAEIGNASPLLDKAQIRELLDEVLPRCREVAEQTGVRISVRPAIDHETGDRQEIIDRVGGGTYSRLFFRDDHCRHTDTMVAIDPGGDVRLCTQPLPQFDPEMVVGNVNEATLASILVSDRAEAFRAISGHLDACRYCTLDHRIGDEVGGCLVGTGGVER